MYVVGRCLLCAVWAGPWAHGQYAVASRSLGACAPVLPRYSKCGTGPAVVVFCHTVGRFNGNAAPRAHTFLSFLFRSLFSQFFAPRFRSSGHGRNPNRKCTRRNAPFRAISERRNNQQLKGNGRLEQRRHFYTPILSNSCARCTRSSSSLSLSLSLLFSLSRFTSLTNSRLISLWTCRPSAPSSSRGQRPEGRRGAAWWPP